MSNEEPFDFGTISLRPLIPQSYVLLAECVVPTCGWVMAFSTTRMDTIVATCRDHPCRKLCRCAQPPSA